MTRPMTFVGRKREIEQVTSALTASVVVRISGEAGIGKSRLAREVMRIARERGFVVQEAACFPYDASRPYAPFRELLRDEHDEAVASAIDADEAIDAANISPAAIHERQREAFLAWRRWLEARGQPLCLCIEDLHWCDEVSLALLADIALRPLGVPHLVLVTFRDEPSTALAAWRALVDRSRRVLDIPLAPLSAAESEELLRGLLVEENAEALLELADGHPFFLEELAKAARNQSDTKLPRSIADAAGIRLERLDGDARALLDLAAVEGRDFDAGFLGPILGADERDLARRLRQLVDENFIVERSAERFSFRHALLRVAVLDRQLARERRELHRRIARALVAAGSRDVDARARHWFGAEEWDEALTCSVSAATAAFALHAFRSAQEHWSRALDAAARIGRAPSPDWSRALGLACELLEEFDAAHTAYQASLALGRDRRDALAEWHALVSLGRLWTRRDYVRAGDYFERARQTVHALEDPLVRAESTNAMGSWLLNIGRDAEAVAMHASVLPLLDAEPHARAQTLDRLGMSNGLAGRLAAAVPAYDEAVALWRNVDDPLALAASLQGRAVFGSTALSETVPWSGRSSTECLADALESVQLAERARVPSLEAFARMGLACVHAARDEIGPALAEADACRRIAHGAGHDEWAIGGRFIRSLALLRIFAAHEARDALRELLPDAERTGSAWWSCNTRAYLALACVHCHDVAGAKDALKPTGPPLGSAAERRLAWARAELAFLQRDGAATRAVVDDLLRSHPGDARAAIPQLDFLRGAAFVLERRYGSGVQALQRARAAASSGLGLTMRIHAALAAAFTAQGRKDDAERARADLDRARDDLLARAVEVGREECRVGIDRVLSPPGRVALRKQEAERFSGLTRREREIAELIADGASNGVIARTLGVSPRTIETHVEHIREKLAVKSRVEIAVWASRQLS